MIVLIAVTVGMRASEIFGLRWSDVMYSEGLIAVRAKLKGGKMRYVPMSPELAGERRRFPAVIDEDRIFPTEGRRGKRAATRGREVRRSARTGENRELPLSRSPTHVRIWYMMNGGDLYELAKILGHSNIKMIERYAELNRKHIAKTSSTAREIWKLMEQEKCDDANVG